VRGVVRIGARDAREEVLERLAREQIAILKRRLAEIGEQRVACGVGADRADRAAPAGVRRSDDDFRSFGHLTPRLRISVTDG
jgi:hypothetical protein